MKYKAIRQNIWPQTVTYGVISEFCLQSAELFPVNIQSIQFWILDCSDLDLKTAHRIESLGSDETQNHSCSDRDGSQCWSWQNLTGWPAQRAYVNLRLELQVSPERFKGSASTTNLPRWSNYVISLRQGRRLTLGAIRGWLRCTESRQSSRSSYSGWVPTINSFRWRLQCHPGQLHATRTCGINRRQHFLLWNSNSSKSGSLSVSLSVNQSVYH